MNNLEFNELNIKVSGPENGVVRLDWFGKSNDRQPRTVLDPFFQEVTGFAQQNSAKVEMHFEQLEYFNSSTITTIIQVIQDFRAKNIGLVILYNGALKWQKLSFEALRIFEKSDKLLEIKTL